MKLWPAGARSGWREPRWGADHATVRTTKQTHALYKMGSTGPLPKRGTMGRANGGPCGSRGTHKCGNPPLASGEPSYAPNRKHRGLPCAGGAPDATALPPIATHPTGAREIGLPSVVRGTLPSIQPRSGVVEPVPRQPRLPMLGAMSEKLRRIRATTVANDPRSCIPAGSSVPVQPTLVLKRAKARGVAEHATECRIHSAVGRSKATSNIRDKKQARVAKPTFPPCPERQRLGSQTGFFGVWPSRCDARTEMGPPSPR